MIGLPLKNTLVTTYNQNNVSISVGGFVNETANLNNVSNVVNKPINVQIEHWRTQEKTFKLKRS